MVVRVDFGRERVLRGGGRKKIERRVGRVPGLSFEVMEGGVWKMRRGVGWKKGANDVVSAFGGGDEGGGRNLSGGEKAGAAEFNWEKGLRACGVRETATKETREGGKLKRVEVGEDRKEGIRVASPKTIRHFRKGVAVAEKTEFQLGVVEIGESVEDGGNLVNPGGNGVT